MLPYTHLNNNMFMWTGNIKDIECQRTSHRRINLTEVESKVETRFGLEFMSLMRHIKWLQIPALSTIGLNRLIYQNISYTCSNAQALAEYPGHRALYLLHAIYNDEMMQTWMDYEFMTDIRAFMHSDGIPLNIQSK